MAFPEVFERVGLFIDPRSDGGKGDCGMLILPPRRSRENPETGLVDDEWRFVAGHELSHLKHPYVGTYLPAVAASLGIGLGMSLFGATLPGVLAGVGCGVALGHVARQGIELRCDVEAAHWLDCAAAGQRLFRRWNRQVQLSRDRLGMPRYLLRRGWFELTDPHPPLWLRAKVMGLMSVRREARSR